MMPTLEQRIAALEDIENIKRLKHSYCYIADAGTRDARKMEDFAELFVEDAWVDFDFMGVHKGRHAVLSFYKDQVANILSYSAHMLTNPLIDLDGDRATGKWYVLVPNIFRAVNLATWLQGVYTEEYVKVDGRWKWQSITVRFDHITPYEQGWAKQPMLDLGFLGGTGS